MAVRLRTIKQDQRQMKSYDNAWADKYVRDVGWLLNRLADASSVLRGLSVASTTNGSDVCWCHADTRPRTQGMQAKNEHWPICQRTSALYEKLIDR
jgi:hypothetical protein